ncbi:glutaredoxin family protein [Pseudolysobacter antarcticus]|uniref:Glutaredoxin family protein n=1 Tax=Pseudolysobacter antarcticus TaxID=2511995 RepID=A0A411HMT3_9GAMM|nr:glutaredoxin family protein [Pseudolysobacter antarcticus]QBB71784.1 glutaredoxin family protein [Pseudolysobacter antarcticus]
MALVLYGRGDCALCWHAEEALRHADVVAVPIDVDSDAALETRYGERIPVLRNEDNGTELDWPFDAYAIRKFCATA